MHPLPEGCKKFNFFDRHFSLRKMLLVSFFAHILLFLPPLLFTFQTIETIKKKPPLQLEIVVEAPISKAPPPVSSKTQTNLPLKQLKLSDLAPLTNGESKVAPVINSKTKNHGLATSLEHRFQQMQNIGIFQQIYSAIDRNLIYPDELKNNQISGVVTATLYFSEDGSFLDKGTKIKSDSRYLKVLVLQILRKALKKTTFPNPSTKKPFDIECTFHFEITEGDTPNAGKGQHMITDNSFFFYRNFPHSFLQWKLGPLQGLGPLAGLDLLWPFRKASDLLSNKSKPDPLQKYRDDPNW